MRNQIISAAFILSKCTGFGWLTINIQRVYVKGRIDGAPCGFDHSGGCDPSIKIFVNDELMFETPKLLNQFAFDAKVTFTTLKIRKNSIVRIEVWHVRRTFFDEDGLIQSVEGDIKSYLNEPLRQGDHFYEAENRIETISFWRDEYQ